MLPGLPTQLGQHGPDHRRGLGSEHLLLAEPMPGEEIERNEQLPAGGIPGQRGDQVQDALGKSGMMSEMIDVGHRANDDPCSQREQRSARVAEIAIQCGHRGHRIVVEIELMLVDQACEAIDRKGEALHRQQQFSGDGIAFDTAMFLACQRIVPPLQA